MKKSELKALLKPLIKECIKESILEEGILSNVIMEVTKGLGATPIVEQKKPQAPKPTPTPTKSVNQRLAEHKKNLMSAIGSDAYGGVDLFEGTTPAPGQASEAQMANPMSGTDPTDAGVDISGILSVAGKNWKNLVR
mgnify:CR=1 FL=1